ncbi:nucleophosmin-like isoform X1 [Oncorhynchus nerka]|uniref:nucleophosmin-like isoform X1 n=1 Tax=Oncorhynchus nerka TaxID=8023 RepID=UPI0011325BB2|nr:nucleophosmin-like isoform X1 [Oncorhynchus nerka]
MADDSVPDITRFQMYLFGCTLKSDRKEFKVEEEDDADHQLSLKAVCLGPEAEDTFHTVEIEGVTYDGKTTKIPLAVLKPSVLPSMSLGGFGITPPVTFRLQSGCGPVYISGQHFINVKDSDDEEEENSSSPVKRPSSLTSGKRPAPKKLKMESNDDDDSDEDDDDDDDDDNDDDSDEDESDVKVQKVPVIPTIKKSPEPLGQKPKSVTLAQNGSPGNQGGPLAKPQTKTPVGEKDKSQKEKSGAGPSNVLTVPEIKSKLASLAKEGKPLPKTEAKFENFAKSSLRMSDKKDGSGHRPGCLFIDEESFEMNPTA